jgi:hypothetical protein
MDIEPARQQWLPVWLKLWIWELLAMLVALGILIGIGLLLGKHDGKPMPQWEFGLNINSVAAVLATVFRALILVFIKEGESLLSPQTA